MTSSLVLAIESSCDETAAAVVDGDGHVLSDVVSTQVDAHAPYGGVVPEIASREHLARIDSVVGRALADAGVAPSSISAVACTYGPGLIGALLVGLSYAKGFAQALGTRFIGIHHIEGHLAAAQGEPDAAPAPFIGLVVSGGHTALYRFDGPGRIRLLGETLDDAAGEAFDKSAKLMGLGYPGGAVVDARASRGDDARFKFPISLRQRTTLDFSFSGLKTAVRLQVEKLERDAALDDETIDDVCASLQFAIVKALIAKSMLACRREKIDALVLGGGVAANTRLRADMVKTGIENDVRVLVPPRRLCTDNAVMIAHAAHNHLRQNRKSALSLRADPGARVDAAVHAFNV